MISGFALLFGVDAERFPLLGLRILPPILGPVGCYQTALGLLFAVWARLHLGRYWSGRITIKEGHRLIRTGPYRWARHPIYTGILCAFTGSVLTQGRLAGLLALLIVSVSFWRKIYLEELALHGRFGREYQDYTRATGLLLPWP
jgi:protein-S-isoprenylcysteine O-methyltransferase Ste14